MSTTKQTPKVFSCPAKVIYDAYPGSDLLPVEPPTDTETLQEFYVRVMEAQNSKLGNLGDSLFCFVLSEIADDCDDADIAIRRLSSAQEDIKSVQDAIENLNG